MKGRGFLATAAIGGLILAGVSKQGDGGGAQPESMAAVPVSVNGNVALGQQIAANRYGWTGSQWDCLYNLWQGESGWSQTSDTRASGLDAPDASVFAYGIPQARGHGPDVDGVTAPYPSSFMAANPASLGGSSDPRTQVRWGLAYIRSTYGSPCAALAFKQAHNDKGY